LARIGPEKAGMKALIIINTAAGVALLAVVGKKLA
jgi:hypothetical protein